MRQDADSDGVEENIIIYCRWKKTSSEIKMPYILPWFGVTDTGNFEAKIY